MNVRDIPIRRRKKWFSVLNKCVVKWTKIVNGGDWEDCPACSYAGTFETAEVWACDHCPLSTKNACCDGKFEDWENAYQFDDDTTNQSKAVLSFIVSRRDALRRLIEKESK